MRISEILSVIFLWHPSFLGRLLRPKAGNKNVLECFLCRAHSIVGGLQMVWGEIFEEEQMWMFLALEIWLKIHHTWESNEVRIMLSLQQINTWSCILSAKLPQNSWHVFAWFSISTNLQFTAAPTTSSSCPVVLKPPRHFSLCLREVRYFDFTSLFENQENP